MSEKQERVIEIRVTRWAFMVLAVGLTIVLVPLLLTLTDSRVEAEGAAATSLRANGMRQYYLTQTGAAGASASTHCAAGYHMASMWEIADPSNLSYNTSLGMTSPDSGSGPTTEYIGWVRTGYVANDTSTPGRANCLTWQSSGAGDYGSAARLPNDWGAGADDLGVWDVGAYLCYNNFPVWCVEDAP